ncbi:hypothetical protein H8959_013333 [Pygathrix nigripes]
MPKSLQGFSRSRSVGAGANQRVLRSPAVQSSRKKGRSNFTIAACRRHWDLGRVGRVQERKDRRVRFRRSGFRGCTG